MFVLCLRKKWVNMNNIRWIAVPAGAIFQIQEVRDEDVVFDFKYYGQLFNGVSNSNDLEFMPTRLASFITAIRYLSHRVDFVQSRERISFLEGLSVGTNIKITGQDEHIRGEYIAVVKFIGSIDLINGSFIGVEYLVN